MRFLRQRVNLAGLQPVHLRIKDAEFCNHLPLVGVLLRSPFSMLFRHRLTHLLALVVLAPALSIAQSAEPITTTPEAPVTLEPAPVPTPSVAQQASPGVRPATQGPVLSLEECVTRALNKNFALRIQRFETDNAKEALLVARAVFDPALELTTSRFGTRDPQRTVNLNAQGDVVIVQSTRSGDSTRLGITQELPTGTVVSVGRNLNREKSFPVRTLPNPTYDSDVSLSVRQPLLRNAGTRYNRSGIERAKLGITLANLDLKSGVLTVVRNVESAYYELAFAREQLTVRRFSLEVADKLLEENRSRRTSGVATDLEVLQAEVGVANARRDVLLSEQAVHDREDTLLAEIEPFGFNQPLGDIRLDEDPTPVINAERSYQLARDNTPEYAAARTFIKQLEIDSNVARRNRLPILDVGADVGYSARDDSYSSAASGVWDRKGYSWQVDATLRFPWGLRADRARYRQSLNALRREEVNLQQIEQNILVEVRAAVRSVETNVESARISSLATQLSQRQFELEKARYDAGLSTFRRVQEAQEQFDTARVNELQSRVTLRNALADLSRIEGSSLAHYRIQLQE